MKWVYCSLLRNNFLMRVYVNLRKIKRPEKNTSCSSNQFAKFHFEILQILQNFEGLLTQLLKPSQLQKLRSTSPEPLPLRYGAPSFSTSLVHVRLLHLMQWPGSYWLDSACLQLSGIHPRYIPAAIRSHLFFDMTVLQNNRDVGLNAKVCKLKCNGVCMCMCMHVCVFPWGVFGSIKIGRR